MQQPELKNAIGKLQVKGIVIEENLIEDPQYKDKILSLITKAQEKNILVIIYCGDDNSENLMFKWAKVNAPWVKTANQSDLNKLLVEKKINPNECLFISTGESLLYRMTKDKIHYVLIQPSTDFDSFFEPDYQLPKLYPEIDKFIKDFNFKVTQKKTEKAENRTEISLNADGCLTIKMNDGSTDFIYENIDEFRKMLKCYGFDSSQGVYNLFVKLLMDEEVFLKEDKLSQLGYMPTPALIQYRCSEEEDNEKLIFYLYDCLNEGSPILTKLSNNQFWVGLNFEEDCVYQIEDKVTNRGYQDIRKVKNIDFVNIKILYQELCNKNNLDFNDVWSRVTYPVLYKVNGILRAGLKKEGATLLETSLNPDGVLQIKASKKIEKNSSTPESSLFSFSLLDNKPLIFDNKFLDKIFELTDKEGEIQAKLENVDSLKKLLSCFGICLEDNELRELYRELCKINNFNFKKIWTNIEPIVESSILDMINIGIFSETTVGEKKNTLTPYSISIAVKGVIIEEDLMTDVNFLQEIQALILEAEHKKIPVIIYCSTDTTETNMFKYLKEKNIPWAVTVAQNELKDCLVHKGLKSNECLFLSAGISLLYAKTKKTNNYVIVNSAEDFGLFLKPEYKLQKPLVDYAKCYPETCQLIDRLNFNLVGNIIVSETKNKSVQTKNKNLQIFMNKHPLKIRLNAEGCLSIYINKNILGMINKDASWKKVFVEFFDFKYKDDRVAKFYHIEELRKILKHCGYDFRQESDVNVRRLTGINDSLTLENISKARNTVKIPSLIKYFYGEQSEYFDNSDDEDFLFYYYDSAEDGSLRLTQLANKNNQLGDLKLEFDEKLDVSDEKYKIICDEVRLAKQMYCVNFEKLYQELCQQAGLNFNLVWRKAQHYPTIGYVCSSLSAKISQLGGGVEKADDVHENLVSLKLEACGDLYVVVDKGLSSKIKSNTFLNYKGFKENSDGIWLMRCKTAENLGDILSYLKIPLKKGELKELYRELCQIEGHDFARIWDNVDEIDDDCVLQ